MSSIKKNFSYNLVYQILNLVILLVTSPLYRKGTRTG